MSFERASAALFKAIQVRQIATKHCLVIRGVRVVHHHDGAVAILRIDVVGQRDHIVRGRRTKGQRPAIEAGLALAPVERAAAIERDIKRTPTGRKTTSLLIPEDTTGVIVRDLLGQRALPLQDGPIPVHPVACVGAEPHLLRAAQASAIQTDIHSPTANVQRAGVAAVSACQSQSAGALILVDFACTSQVAGEGGHAATAPCLDIGPGVDFNRIGDRYVVGRIGGAQIENLAVETCVAAAVLKLTIHGTAIRLERNGQVSAVSGKATLIVPVHLSGFVSGTDLTGKGAAGPQDTVPETHSRQSGQAHSLTGHEDRRVTDIRIPGVGVGAGQMGV